MLADVELAGIRGAYTEDRVPVEGSLTGVVLMGYPNISHLQI